MGRRGCRTQAFLRFDISADIFGRQFVPKYIKCCHIFRPTLGAHHRVAAACSIDAKRPGLRCYSQTLLRNSVHTIIVCRTAALFFGFLLICTALDLGSSWRSLTIRSWRCECCRRAGNQRLRACDAHKVIGIGGRRTQRRALDSCESGPRLSFRSGDDHKVIEQLCAKPVRIVRTI